MLVLVYTGDAAQDQASMQSVVQAVLSAAAKAGITTLAMPLLGAGLARWPMLVAKAQVAEVLQAAHHRSGGTRLQVRSASPPSASSYSGLCYEGFNLDLT